MGYMRRCILRLSRKRGEGLHCCERKVESTTSDGSKAFRMQSGECLTYTDARDMVIIISSTLGLCNIYLVVVPMKLSS